MITTLRQLLIQRAARLQGRPALSAPGWGRLDYIQFRNRVEGIALGLMASPPPPETVHCHTGTAWDWACEVATACCGLRWDADSPSLGPEHLGGIRFNAEAGRQPYHDREDRIDGDTPFLPGLSHGELLARLQRLNTRLQWDHETHIALPLARISEPELRAALWSALFAGAHAELLPDASPVKHARGFFSRAPLERVWDPGPFRDLFSE